MKNYLFTTLFLATFSSAALAANLTPTQAQKIASTVNVNNVVGGTSYQHDGKDYYLLFTHLQTRQTTKEESLDKISISARFVAPAEKGNKVLWSVVDSVSCPGLDISADFIPEATTFNKITPHTGSSDNIEVTLAYKMFCGGGVDPKTLKVIYHDSTQKYALRGETEIYFTHDKSSTGGSYKTDAQFNTAPKQIQEFMKKLWNSIKTEKM